MMKQRSNRMMYALSTCLVLLVVIMGVATMNNFDKMKSVQNTLENLSGVSKSDDGQVQQTDGKVTSVGDPSTGENAARTGGMPDAGGQIQEAGQAGAQSGTDGQAGVQDETAGQVGKIGRAHV